MNRAFPPSSSPNGQPKERDPVAAYLDQLNILWKQAEEELTAMRVSIPIEIEIAAGYGAYAQNADEPDWHKAVYLGWRELMKGWRICVGTLTDHLDGAKPTCQWKPITESPKERRIELAEHYPKLKAKLKEARQNLVPQAAAAIAALKQALGD